MPVATLSNEGKILTLMAEVRIDVNNLSKITALMSHTRLGQALNGERPLKEGDARHILEYLERMKELTAAVPNYAKVDWSRTSVIQNALVTRLAHSIVSEQGDNRFSEAARKATEAAVG